MKHFPKEMELVDDFIAPELDNFEIKRGVSNPPRSNKL